MASSHHNDNDELFRAQTHMYRHIYSFITPESIRWAIDLGIPDIIHNHGQPITLSHLVSTLHVPQQKVNSFYRFMRFLVHQGYFVIVKIDDDNEAYALTSVSKLLVKGTGHCLSPMAEYMINSIYRSNNITLPWAKWTLGKERTMFDISEDSDKRLWDFVHQDPERMKAFNEAMESDSQVIRLALRDCKSVFEGLDSIVDVGGGTGNTAKIICETFPKLKCTVLELPQVVADLQPQQNLSFIGGNMFESIPQTNAVLLKWVLHNWSDDDCIKILKNCKEAVSSKGKEGKVIIIDIVINEKEDEHEMTELKLSMDILMMVSLNGKERDEKDWKDIIYASGFKHYKISPIFGFRALIELYP